MLASLRSHLWEILDTLDPVTANVLGAKRDGEPERKSDARLARAVAVALTKAAEKEDV